RGWGGEGEPPDTGRGRGGRGRGGGRGNAPGGPRRAAVSAAERVVPRPGVRGAGGDRRGREGRVPAQWARGGGQQLPRSHLPVPPGRPRLGGEGDCRGRQGRRRTAAVKAGLPGGFAMSRDSTFLFLPDRVSGRVRQPRQP